MKSIALVADAFPPLTTSAAVQLGDLSLEFAKQGYHITVLVPDSKLSEAWCVDSIQGVQICRLRTPPTKDMGYIRRTISEFLTPFFMLHQYRKSPLAQQKWDGVVWYSPSIFLGPVAHYLMKQSRCRSYLILRDIFPQWAVDLGLMKKSLPYLLFKWVESYQYRVADIIGVQSQANLSYFKKISNLDDQCLEVLQNWISPKENIGCSIDLASSVLANRKILVYAGNIGVSQDTSVFLDLAQALASRKDVGLVFVGRGSHFGILKQEASNRMLSNTLFFDEIPSGEIPGLYAQCSIGLVALDTRHKTHNIPGKFLSYMEAELPVLAKLNPSNDLINLISDEHVGYSTSSDSVDQLNHLAEQLINELDQGKQPFYRSNCKVIMGRLFATDIAVKQILAGLNI